MVVITNPYLNTNLNPNPNPLCKTIQHGGRPKNEENWLLILEMFSESLEH